MVLDRPAERPSAQPGDTIPIEVYVREIENYKRKLAHEQALRIQAERMLAEAEPFLAWENALFANKEFEAIDKLLIRERWIVEHTKKPTVKQGQTRWRLDIKDVAQQVGASPSTVTRRTQILEDNGILAREELPYVKLNGDECSLVWSKLTEEAARPDQLKPATPRKHGGTRPKDKCECGWDMKVTDKGLVNQETATCTNPDCGKERVYPPRLTDNPVKGNWEAVEDKQQGTITLQRRKPEPLQVAKDEIAPVPLQLACLTPIPLDKQVASVEKAYSAPPSPARLRAEQPTPLASAAENLLATERSQCQKGGAPWPLN
jgi:AraC-like DNA-binding protein